MKALEYKKNAVIKAVALGTFFWAALSVATPEEADQAEEKARASFVDAFKIFIQDKNVMGRAKGPDGKASDPGPNKNQFNKDDGASYKSDLTYHDNSYSTDDNAYNQKNKEASSKPSGRGGDTPDTRSLPAFVSEHGGLSEAGGSSQLERKMYELHDKFWKQEHDDKKAKKEDEEKGIKYRSTFKVETREVFKKDTSSTASSTGSTTGSSTASSGKDKKDEAEKVERVTIREEAKPEVNKVGEDSYQTIDRAAKEKGFQDDPQTLANSTFLREAAARATEAWWNSTLANLNQRWVNKGTGRAKPKLSEDTPTCAEWAQKELAQRVQETSQRRGGKPVTAQEQEELKKELETDKLECEQLVKLPYNTINPKFETTEDGKGEELKTGDVLKEDAYARDLRNQLEVLKSAGKDVTKLEGNWKYGADEGKQKLTIGFDESGNPSEKADWSVTDQLNSYNQQLDDAAKGFKDVKERFPKLQVNEDDIKGYKIEPESLSAMEINKMTPKMKEDFGVKVDPNKSTDDTPENYVQLLEKSKGNGGR